MAKLKELKCGRCGDLFEQDYRKLAVCDQCNEELEIEKEIEKDETEDPDEYRDNLEDR